MISFYAVIDELYEAEELKSRKPNLDEGEGATRNRSCAAIDEEILLINWRCLIALSSMRDAAYYQWTFAAFSGIPFTDYFV